MNALPSLLDTIQEIVVVRTQEIFIYDIKIPEMFWTSEKQGEVKILLQTFPQWKDLKVCEVHGGNHVYCNIGLKKRINV